MALKSITGADIKKSRAFKDFGMAFSKNAFTYDVGVVKNDNAIKQAIRNLILTVPGEKPFNPTVGCRVREMLFEPLDAFVADAIQDEIINTINQYEPRVELSDVAVRPFADGNKLAVTVEYRIVGIPIKETINFVLQRPE
tara:strand:- start:4521 stop:4940 length:420 start_codon:yes stop_codon:yes gene_type:complete